MKKKELIEKINTLADQVDECLRSNNDIKEQLRDAKSTLEDLPQEVSEIEDDDLVSKDEE